MVMIVKALHSALSHKTVFSESCLIQRSSTLSRKDAIKTEKHLLHVSNFQRIDSVVLMSIHEGYKKRKCEAYLMRL